MAIKPNDGETFLREVDEELRRERVNQTVARYGWWIVAGMVLVLVAIGGIFWYRGYQHDLAEARGESLLNALDSLESGNRNSATTQIDALAESGSPGYRAAALFARANAQIAANMSTPGGDAGAIARTRVSRSPIGRRRWSVRPSSNSTGCSRSRWSSACPRWRGRGSPFSAPPARWSESPSCA